MWYAMASRCHGHSQCNPASPRKAASSVARPKSWNLQETLPRHKAVEPNLYFFPKVGKHCSFLVVSRDMIPFSSFFQRLEFRSRAAHARPWQNPAESTYFVTSISARNTDTWAFFFRTPFSTTFRWNNFLKSTGINKSVPEEYISVKNSKSTNSPNFFLRWFGTVLGQTKCANFFVKTYCLWHKQLENEIILGGHRAPFFRKWVRTLLFSTFLKGKCGGKWISHMC